MDTESAKQTSGSGFMTWLQLMRLPTIFTALTNVLCGYLIASTQRELSVLLSQTHLWLLMASSAGLYFGGMVLNDVFDARLDAVERPERPIPSGKISRRSASIFGVVLMIVGVGAAAFVGTVALLLAVAIVAAVLLYDGFLKNTPLAPFGMATCRFLNLMLGGSCCCATLPQLWQPHVVGVAMALGVYVFGVTLFAQNEAGQSSRTLLYAGLAIAVSGIVGDAVLAGRQFDETSAAQGTLIALGLIAGNIVWRAMRAIKSGEPRLLQKTVGFMLLNIIFIDAAMTFCFTGSGRLATLVVILVIPATLTRRFVKMS